MDKRTFIKTSSLLLGGAIILPFPGCNNPTGKKNTMQTTTGPLKNWAGNLEYSTGNVHYPKTLEEVQEVVKNCDKLKALGSRHSFNTIADSNQNQVSLQEMNKVLSLDKKRTR